MVQSTDVRKSDRATKTDVVRPADHSAPLLPRRKRLVSERLRKPASTVTLTEPADAGLTIQRRAPPPPPCGRRHDGRRSPAPAAGFW